MSASKPSRLAAFEIWKPVPSATASTSSTNVRLERRPCTASVASSAGLAISGLRVRGHHGSLGARFGELGEQAAEHVELEVRARDIECTGQWRRLAVEHDLAAPLREPKRERLALLEPAIAHLAQQRHFVEAVQEDVALHDLREPLLAHRGQPHLPRALAQHVDDRAALDQ